MGHQQNPLDLSPTTSATVHLPDLNPTSIPSPSFYRLFYLSPTSFFSFSRLPTSPLLCWLLWHLKPTKNLPFFMTEELPRLKSLNNCTYSSELPSVSTGVTKESELDMIDACWQKRLLGLCGCAVCSWLFWASQRRGFWGRVWWTKKTRSSCPTSVTWVEKPVQNLSFLSCHLALFCCLWMLIIDF